MPEAPPGVQPIAGFHLGHEESLGGIFVYEKDAALGGWEVCGLAGDAPRPLTDADDLRPSPDA